MTDAERRLLLLLGRRMLPADLASWGAIELADAINAVEAEQAERDQRTWGRND